MCADGDALGAATRGPALLTGLLRCRRCGRKLTVWYTGNAHNVLRYACHRGALDNGEPRCISFGGLVVDAAMAKEILRVVQPAAIEAAVVASEDASRQQDEVLAGVDARPGSGALCGAAGAEAIRCDRSRESAWWPTNWSGAGIRPCSVSTRSKRASISTSQGQRQRRRPHARRIRDLAADLEAVWQGPHADVRLKKRLVRTLIHEVVVDVDAEAGEVILAHSLERRRAYRAASPATTSRAE